MDDAEKELLSSPIFRNLIISNDATTTGVLINFNRDSEYEYLIKERDRLRDLDRLSNEDIEKLEKINEEYEISKKNFDNERHNNINEVRKLIKKFDSDDLEVHLGGVSMIADDTITFVKNDIFIFGIGAIIFILIVLFIVFKNPLWMFACISNCLASLFDLTPICSLSI